MRGRVKAFFTHLVAAFGFLTIVPGLGSISLSPGGLGKSSSFFPVVGLVIGMGLYLICPIPAAGQKTIKGVDNAVSMQAARHDQKEKQ